MKFPLISITKIADDYIASTGSTESLDANFLYRQAHDDLGEIYTGDNYIHNIGLFPVMNYKMELPMGFKYVDQAAFSADYDKPIAEEVVELTKKIMGTDCDLKVSCKPCSTYNNCNAEIITIDTTDVWLHSHPEFAVSYMRHFNDYQNMNTRKSGRCMYHPEFTLMKHTTNSMFNIPYHVNECLNFSADYKVEYSIQFPYLITNMKEGKILLSYFGAPLDENGFLMIPEVSEVIKYLVQGLITRQAFIDYRMTKSQQDRIFWQQMIELKESYKKSAIIRLRAIAPDEFESIIRNHWLKIIPDYKYELTNSRGVADSFRYPNQLYTHN